MNYANMKLLAGQVLGKGVLRTLEPAMRSCLGLIYRGRDKRCPCCTTKLRKFVDNGEICPRCGSGKRQRLQWLYLDREHNFFAGDSRVLDIAPMPWFQRYCRKQTNLVYRSADVDSPLATDQVDITKMPYPDTSFDFILCSHVLEHVDDDRQAMQELHRILAPRGIALVQVPIAGASTDEAAGITDPAQRTERFGQADHVRQYGMDIVGRLTAAGFDVTLWTAGDCLSDADITYHDLDRSEVLFVCRP